MANGEDHIRFEATFKELAAYMARAEAAIQEQIGKAVAMGDETQVAKLRAQQAQLRGAGVTSADVEATVRALESESRALSRNITLGEQNLAILRLQAQQQRQIAELSRPMGHGPTQPSAGPPLQQQLAHERELLATEKERLNVAERTAAVQRGSLLQAAGNAYRTGAAAGLRGGLTESGARTAATTIAPAGLGRDFTAAEQAAMRYRVTLGEYDALTTKAATSTRELSTNLTRLAVAEAQDSNALRRHGALTTEYLTALARGETTVSEFGYQLGATIGKFAGWAAAATATYAAFGVVHEFAKGATDAASGVERLHRTIDGLNVNEATRALEGLSKDTNVPIKEAADAMFLYSRSFHNVTEATAAAHDGLAVFKLDNVQIQDSMQLSTLVLQQFGARAQEQHGMWDMLAAGQREYNARISQTVPLIRAAGAAAKNAGGDLTSLAQIAILGAKTYPGQGGQVGTAIARGVAVQIPKNLGELQQRFGIGIGEGPQDSFKILQEAIRKSGSLGPNDRRELAQLVLEKRFGSKYAGLFTESAAQFLGREQGQGPGAISPGANKGKLDEELSRELKTFHERTHSFVNEMQRWGAAIGASGVLTGIAGLIGGLVKLGGAFRGVVNEFDQLPNAAKVAIEGVLALRLAMLFFSRTRIGSSVPGARYFRIPGIDPAFDSQRQRAELARGNRGAIEESGSSLQQTQSQLRTTAEQRLQLARRLEELDAQIGTAGRGSEAQMERRNAMTVKLLALERQQTELEAQRAAQRATLADLEQKQVGLTATNRTKRFKDAQVGAMAAGMETGASGVMLTQVQQHEKELQAQETRLASARRLLNEAEAQHRPKIQEVINGLEQGIVTTQGNLSSARAAEGATGRATGALGKAGQGLRGFFARMGGLARAIDPITALLIAGPIVFDMLKDGWEKADKAAQATHKTMQGPVNAASDLAKQAAAVQQQADKLHKDIAPGGLKGLLPTTGLKGIATLLHGGAGKQADLAAQGEEYQNITRFYDAAALRFMKDVPELLKTHEGQKKLYAESQRLKQQMGALLQSSGLPKDVIGKLYQAFIDQLQKEYARATQNDPGHGGSPFSRLENMKLPDIQKEIQGIDDFAKIYGANNESLRKAAEDYAFAVNKFGKSTNSKDLQTLYSMQQNFISAVTKNVQDKLHASESSTTFSGQQGNVQAAIGVIEQARQQEQRSLNEIIAYNHGNAKAIDRAKKAANQVFAQLNDQLKQAIQQDLDLIKTQSAERTSQIGGISAESDIARARSDLSGLEQELAKARQDGADWKVVHGILTEINNKRHEIVKATIENDRAILEARDQLAKSQITGIGPEADIARARADVKSAQDLLAYDQRTGAGEAKIITDMAAVNNAVFSLNQQMQQRAQQLSQEMAAFIESETALAQSQTLDPIKQAREQVSGDLRVLGTIHRSDFQSQRQYLTALNNQRAKINNDRQKLNDQIIQTDLSTLQFRFNTERIGDQQYINALQRILRTKKLTLQERQQIMEQIYQLKHSQNNLDLNVGQIKLPSIYQIRRAIGLGKRGELPGSQNTVINHSASVVVNVYGRDGARAVGAVLDKHLNTSIRAAMRARGAI